MTDHGDNSGGPDPANPAGKQRASCDQCRQRKLKCSGEPGGCARCKREGVTCHYSLQKPMGRPRKRRREGEADNDPDDKPNGGEPLPPLDPALADTSFPDFPQDAAFSTGTVTATQLAGLDFNLDALPADLFDPMVGEAKQLSVDQIHATPLAPATSTSCGTQVTPSPPSTVPELKCYCLSTMFLATSDLQKETSGIGFPFILAPLKSALSKADDIMNCDVCPRGMSTLRENTLLLITLLNSIADAFDKLLRQVDAEAAELEASGQRKNMRLGVPMSPETFHLHTGTDNCPMGMNVDLDPQEWRMLSYRATKNDVFDKKDGKLTLEGLLNRLEARQEAWHEASGHAHMGNACACIHMTSTIRRALQNLPAG